MNLSDEILDRYLDGQATQEECELVHQELETPSQMARFARRAELHQQLRRTLRRRSKLPAVWSTPPAEFTPIGHGDGQGNANEVLPVHSRESRERLGRAVRVFTWFTAACMIALLLKFAWAPPKGTSSPWIATVVKEVNSELIRDETPWTPPNLTPGPYRLRRGLMHLQFDEGVMVLVEAPAKFDVVNGKQLALHQGRISSLAPASAIGFTVLTPEAEVVDQGTDFSVDVDSGTSEVHVFDGSVRVHPRLQSGMAGGDPVELTTSQAVKIDESTRSAVDIQLARDRFIRRLDEPRQKYARVIRRLAPVAFYRMPIRDRGLIAEPPEYSGTVLTGVGVRPPHARGVFTGGSLRVKANSSGRGGRIDSPPRLNTGRFALAAFVYLENLSEDGIIATNQDGDLGNFTLSVSGSGRIHAEVRDTMGSVHSLQSQTMVPRKTWLLVVLTVDGDRLQLFENGSLVASQSCPALGLDGDATLWIGTSPQRNQFWDGRIDELALFNKSLDETEISLLYQTALEEIAETP